MYNEGRTLSVLKNFSLQKIYLKFQTKVKYYKTWSFVIYSSNITLFDLEGIIISIDKNEGFHCFTIMNDFNNNMIHVFLEGKEIKKVKRINLLRSFTSTNFWDMKHFSYLSVDF